MSVSYTINDDGKYVCSCGEFTGSRSGWYKHKAVKHSLPKEDSEDIPIIEESSQEDGEESTDESSWMDWGNIAQEENATDFMPSPLKSLQKKAVKSKRSKKTKEEIKSARTTSKSLVTLGLTLGDTVLSIWGRGVLLDKEFNVQHTDTDKETTADAVVGAMEEKGLFLSDSISRTTVATVMVGWYFGAPVYRISKRAEKGFFKGGRGSGLLSRIPLIGRLFRRKKKKRGLTVKEVEMMSNEE